jgi:Fic family protein
MTFHPSSMEPMLPADGRHSLDDLALDLIAKSSALAARLHPVVRESVGDLVRSMNCYYSNLIEGHDTHPRDIDRALAAEFSSDPKRRALQYEARAHIEVQRMLDQRLRPTDDADLVSPEFIGWIHQEFYQRLPDELCRVENPDSGEGIQVIPGRLRAGTVQVGRHLPPAAADLAPFLRRFGQAYQPSRLSRLQRILAAAASHHRLLWIHPFYDGNGRVTRLFSHAYLTHIGIGTSLWSVSRGLARKAADYKAHLIAADQPRLGDLDGRGNLSAQGLESFCAFFLATCIDQVEFMGALLEPLELSRRIELYAEESVRAGRLPKGSWPLLREALLAGALERGRAPALTGYQQRQARSVLAALVQQGLLVSDTPKGPVRLGFPIEVVERWFPKLYPAIG